MIIWDLVLGYGDSTTKSSGLLDFLIETWPLSIIGLTVVTVHTIILCVVEAGQRAMLLFACCASACVRYQTSGGGQFPQLHQRILTARQHILKQ